MSSSTKQLVLENNQVIPEIFGTQDLNLKLIEKKFTYKQLLDADEVFLTSSGSFITPILKVDKNKINNGEIGNITLKLAQMYSKSFMNG